LVIAAVSTRGTVADTSLRGSTDTATLGEDAGTGDAFDGDGGRHNFFKRAGLVGSY
jgi:hypothetical protein